jgi:flagellin-like hook-associated protein FlgL
MSDIILSAGVRQNLLALQDTAALMATTQNRLATGKKVNSALDNPSNYFTSQGLSNRASDLNSLLDAIGQAQQTLQAANTGLTSLTSLVQSAKSLLTQAQQSAKGGVNYTNVTGTNAIALDTTSVTS